MDVNSLNVDLTLQLTAELPLPKDANDGSAYLDTPLRKKLRRHKTSKQVSGIFGYARA